LIEQFPRGDQLLADLKVQNMELLPHCPPDMKSQLMQDFSSHSTRLGNLQASLRTWLDKVNRLLQMNQSCQDKLQHILTELSSQREILADLSVPATFGDLRQYIKSVEVNIGELIPNFFY